VIALAVLQFAAGLVLLIVAVFLALIAADPRDRALAGTLSAVFVLCAGIVITGGLRLW
jgi:hypothetical protein